MSTDQRRFDVVIIGAGMSGLCMLHQARKAGLTAKLFEGGYDLGGTWFWNRYPGCRCDIESVEYSFSFEKELQKEWSWSERYAGQPEILRYMNWAADRLQLRSDMEFNTWIESATFNEETDTWTVKLHSGELVHSQFLVTATGCLSAPKDIDIAGAEDFAGETYYTYKWPHQEVDFSGKRIAVVGAGSSAIQSIPIIAKAASQLTVFMRTANFSVPLRNRPTDKAAEEAYKANYDEYRAMERETFGGFVNVDGIPRMPRTDSALAATDAERNEEFEYRYRSGGLCFYTSYSDLLTDIRANDLLSDFLRNKIRERVKDPRKADILTPRKFPALTKRLCADTGYYETYNLDHVDVVDISKDPIERITPTGIVIAGSDMQFDVVIFATGFDAVTGALDKINIQGRNGFKLKDAWQDGPSTYLGLMTTNFPNLFNLAGPGSTASLTHAIPCDEHQVEVVLQCIDRVRMANARTIEPTQDAEDLWTDHVNEAANMTLFPRANSWYMGANVPEKPRKPLLYLGGFNTYIDKVAKVVADDFADFAIN